MLFEHEEGRKLIRGMNESLDGAARGEPRSMFRFMECARTYAQLLRAHIQKEDHCIFPMAANVLGPAEQDSLVESFVAMDREVPGQGAKERCILLANELADQFGVAHVCVEVSEANLTA